MIDVQSSPDLRRIPLEQVGVCDLRYPVVVLDRENKEQKTVATLQMSVSLPHHFKGTHMSRFIEILNEHRGEVTMRTLPEVLRALAERLDAESAEVRLDFPYFIERRAPVSGAAAMLDFECGFIARVNGGKEDFALIANVPVTTLCPCSKAISDYGAHSQRGTVRMEVRTVEGQFVWLEELIELAEECGSAPIYPLLKRVDERFVTMQAYDNPAFVEDVVRDVAVRLQGDPRVASYTVEVVNIESIHNHNAFARTSWKRPVAVVDHLTQPAVLAEVG